MEKGKEKNHESEGQVLDVGWECSHIYTPDARVNYFRQHTVGKEKVFAQAQAFWGKDSMDVYTGPHRACAQVQKEKKKFRVTDALRWKISVKLFQ